MLTLQQRAVQSVRSTGPGGPGEDGKVTSDQGLEKGLEVLAASANEGNIYLKCIEKFLNENNGKLTSTDCANSVYLKNSRRVEKDPKQQLTLNVIDQFFQKAQRRGCPHRPY